MYRAGGLAAWYSRSAQWRIYMELKRWVFAYMFHAGYMQAFTYGEHTGYIRGTYRLHKGYIKVTDRQNIPLAAARRLHPRLALPVVAPPPAGSSAGAHRRELSRHTPDVHRPGRQGGFDSTQG